MTIPSFSSVMWTQTHRAAQSAGLLVLVALSACKMRPQPPPPGEHPDDVTPVTSEQARDERLPSLRVPISPIGSETASGTLIFTELDQAAGVQVEGVITGLTPGKHGFHIHENPDCSGIDGLAAGGHFNPTDAPHGAVEDAKSHLGDLGNIEANSEGRAVVHVVKKGATLGKAADSLMGHSILIHGAQDDLTSQPAGASGSRVACGIIAPGGR